MGKTNLFQLQNKSVFNSLATASLVAQMTPAKGEFSLSSCPKRNIIETFNSSNKTIVTIASANNSLISLEVKVIRFVFNLFRFNEHRSYIQLPTLFE